MNFRSIFTNFDKTESVLQTTDKYTKFYVTTSINSLSLSLFHRSRSCSDLYVAYSKQDNPNYKQHHYKYSYFKIVNKSKCQHYYLQKESMDFYSNNA